MRSEEELKQLAKDVVEGRVVTSDNIPPPDVIAAFPLLALLSEDSLKKISMVFEYIEKAGPRAVNGLPSFLTFQYLTKEEYEIFKKYLKEYEKRKKEAELI